MQDDIAVKDSMLANLRSFVGMMSIGLFVFTVAYMIIGKLNAGYLQPLPVSGSKIAWVDDFASFIGFSYAQTLNSLIGFCGFIILAVILIIGVTTITHGECEIFDDTQTADDCEAEPSVWQRLNWASYRKLAIYLKQENPQTVGVILSQLSPGQASKVLERFDEDFAMQVMMCMLSAKEIATEVIENLANSLGHSFFAESDNRFIGSDLKAILSLLGRRVEKRFWCKVQNETGTGFDGETFRFI